MGCFLGLVFAVFLPLAPVFAVQSTDTHHYVLSLNDKKVLIINRQTKVQESIDFAQIFTDSKTLHPNEDLYCFYCRKLYYVRPMVDQLHVVDLDTQSQGQPIPIGNSPFQLLLHQDVLYTVNFSGSISVIDPKTDTLIQTIRVGSGCNLMKIKDGRGYLLNSCNNTLQTVDLTTYAVSDPLPVGNGPEGLCFYEDKAYIMNKLNGTVSVVDVNLFQVIKTIQVGDLPWAIAICQDKACVLNFRSDTVSIIDLTTDTVIKTIRVGQSPERVCIHKDVGYIQCRGLDRAYLINFNTLGDNSFYCDHDVRFQSDGEQLYAGLSVMQPYPTSLKGIEQTFLTTYETFFKNTAFGLITDPFVDHPVYEDPLVFTEMYELFMNCEPDVALALMASLYRPYAFMETPWGQEVSHVLYLGFSQCAWLVKPCVRDMMGTFLNLNDPYFSQWHQKQGDQSLKAQNPTPKIKKKKIKKPGWNKKIEKINREFGLSFKLL